METGAGSATAIPLPVLPPLPEPFATVSHFNPFFYLIDGFRYGFIGQSDGTLAIGAVSTEIADGNREPHELGVKKTFRMIDGPTDPMKALGDVGRRL